MQELQDADITPIFDDFISTDAVEQDSQDLIILPMTTIASFSPDALVQLLSKVKTLLRDDGIFIFSTYKLPDKVQEVYIEFLQDRRYSAEILPALDSNFIPKDSIISEFYRMDVRSTEYGAYSANLMVFTQINREFERLEREIFAIQTYFYIESFLQQCIEEAGGKIIEIDDSSHSRVIICRF